MVLGSQRASAADGHRDGVILQLQRFVSLAAVAEMEARPRWIPQLRTPD